MLFKTLSIFAFHTLCLYPAGTVALPADQKPINYVEADGVMDVRAALINAQIIPQVLSDFIPSLTLSISWPKHHHATLGNKLKPKHVQERPNIKLHDETNNDGCQTRNMTYVVALTDPDAPKRENPKWGEFCHWIITGVPLGKEVPIASTADTADIMFTDFGLRSWMPTRKSKSSVHEVMEWKPPGPPPKTGPHRYVFVVYAPANGTTLPLNLTKPGDRKHWGYEEEGKGVRDWADANGLAPVGANYIYAKNKKQ